MNVNPHLQYLQQQQTQQNSGNASSPQMAQLQMQHQRQLQQQRQQILSQQLQQQQQQHAPGNVLLGALNNGVNSQPNAGLGGNMGNSMNASSGAGVPNYAQQGNPSALLQMQQQLSQQRYGNLGAQQQQAQQTQQPQQNQQNQQQLHMQMVPPMAAAAPPPQVPIIKEVWNFNLEHEFHALRSFINDKTQHVFISIHQEIPGIVARPVGTFKSASDYHFQTLRSNSDLLNLIQLSFCAVKVRNNEVSNSVIWQFNFQYDLTQEMFNEEHLAMLASTSQINFASQMTQGIPHLSFAELMMESGLLLDPSINWLSYHSGYDLGFLVSLLTNDILPNDETEFFWWCAKYFPNFYDLKHIGNQLLTTFGNVAASAATPGQGSAKSAQQPDHPLGAGLNSPKTPGVDMAKGILSNNKPSIEYLAEELHLLPISPVIRQYFTAQSMNQFAGHHQNQQMTSTLHAYLLMECFKELLRQVNSDLSVFEKFKGYLWGLGDVLEGARAAELAEIASSKN